MLSSLVAEVRSDVRGILRGLDGDLFHSTCSTSSSSSTATNISNKTSRTTSTATNISKTSSRTTTSFFMSSPPDDKRTPEYTGVEEAAPLTRDAQPLFPNYLASKHSSAALHAAEKAASYAKMARYFEDVATRHWQIGQSCKENAVRAAQAAEHHGTTTTTTGANNSDLLRNVRLVCARLKNTILESVENAKAGKADLSPDELQRILESASMRKARMLCGEIEKTYSNELREDDEHVRDPLYLTPPDAYPAKPMWPPPLAAG
ncbi:unnamed protein product [Amoebophrya sp. A25]|nr:unnamed protein product [Amoebophrya sp. A25]|eukprot:GSA25T00009534001.1